MGNLAVVVDKEDNVLGYKDRSELKKGDIHRITALWIEDGSENVLIAQRSFNKRNDPGVWGPAAAGSLKPEETYESNAYKEEIGLTGVPLTTLGKKLYLRQDGTGRYVTFYKAIVDKPAEDFKLQKSEVEQVKWISKTDLLNDLRLNRENYTPSNSAWSFYLGEEI